MRLLDAAEQAVIATDLEGHITFWNRYAQQLHGWSEEEVLGRDIVEVTPSSAGEHEAREIMRRLQEGERWTGEFELRRRDVCEPGG